MNEIAIMMVSILTVCFVSQKVIKSSAISPRTAGHIFKSITFRASKVSSAIFIAVTAPSA
jgi:hypothetical protein